VAEGLEVPDSRLVSSPTFVLVQEYFGRLPIYHFDAYRLETADQFTALGVEEYFSGDGVCLIEWADRVGDCLPDDVLEIRIEVYAESKRALACRASGTLSRLVLAKIVGELGQPAD
jgi:tRNA threonylcarbamoyladenosine biosynthesis protein TsaE